MEPQSNLAFEARLQPKTHLNSLDIHRNRSIISCIKCAINIKLKILCDFIKRTCQQHHHNKDSKNLHNNCHHQPSHHQHQHHQHHHHHEQPQQEQHQCNSQCSFSLLKSFYLYLIFCSLMSTALSCGPGRGIGGSRRKRPLRPLVFKEHVPNMSEKTLGASGLSEGAIQRDSPKFKDLVPNYNKDIIFKDEEGTGADRLMTRRCKEKLNILAVSVMNQWPGVRLRVTESWDEDNLHGAESLHYEGRAVDITTSDRDRSKYGMLARLASEAGFDWVYYESRAHIHCSVKSDASHIPHMNGCFTPESSVLLENGERKPMRDLVVGDRVLSMKESGESVFSEIILFMDRDLEQTHEFVQLRTESGQLLTVTPSHLIMIWNPGKNLMDYVFADRIEEGDYLLVHDQGIGSLLRPQRVIELRAVLRKGVVAPLTMEGTIVVDSVAASCYAIINSQSLAHWSLAPMRLMMILKSWLPISSSKTIDAAKTANQNQNQNHHHHPNSIIDENSQRKLTKTKPTTTTNQTSSDALMRKQNGVHWYTKALFRLKDFVVPKSWLYQ